VRHIKEDTLVHLREPGVCVCVSSQGTHACPDGVTWSPPSQKTIEIVA